MRNEFALLILLALSVTACKKETTTDPAPTKAQLITQTWQLQTASLTIIASNLTVPVFTKGVTGNLVDFSTYKLDLTADGKVSHNDGTTLRTGTWQLLNSDTQLVITYSDGTKATYLVDKASATNLDLTYEVLPTTQYPAEKAYLVQLQSLGQDASKGFKIGVKLIPQ